MNSIKTLSLTGLLLAAAVASEVEIPLVSMSEFGARGALQFGTVEWEVEGWQDRPTAPVCEAVERPLDLDGLKRLAAERGFDSTWRKTAEIDLGKRSEGAFLYRAPDGGYGSIVGSPQRRYFVVNLARFFGAYERDEHQMAVVKPLPTKEEAVVICREWLEKLGIDEDLLYRGGDWPAGFDVKASEHFESGTHPVTKKEVEAAFGLKLRFSQNIGGLPACWSGFGGNLMFEIGDGGEFCQVKGQLKAWRKVDDFSVLGREEILDAVRTGFYWAGEREVCEALVLKEVTLEAYHSDLGEVQSHFPLLYRVECECRGGRGEGGRVTLVIPALTQHRSRYERTR